MYTKHFGLSAKPFSLTPNPDALFESSHHSMALTYLEYGIREKLAFILLTGEVGTGKTTLLRSILRTIPSEMAVAEIFNTNVSSGELIRLILQEFEVESAGTDKTENLYRLNRFLIDQYAQGRRCLLVIDEAQNLPREVMEEVRMLSNLSTESDSLLQIILSGQPELRRALNDPSFRQLAQRISVTYNLEALENGETIDYIRYRLKQGGNSAADLFDEEAVQLIHEQACGVPRMINILCDAALLYAFADDKPKVDRAAVELVIRDRQDQWPGLIQPEVQPPAEAASSQVQGHLESRLEQVGTRVDQVAARVELLEQASQLQKQEHLNRIIKELREQVELERVKNERLNQSFGSLRQRVQQLEALLNKKIKKETENQDDVNGNSSESRSPWSIFRPGFRRRSSS